MKRIYIILLTLISISVQAQYSLNLPGGLRTLNGLPADAKYYNTSGTVYTNTAQVISQIVSGARGRGLTVNVNGVEYCFCAGIADADLIPKNGASLPAATASNDGYLTGADWSTFNSKLASGGALGTPSSGTATNLTGLPLTTGVTGILPVSNGGTGTASPGIVAGTNVTVTGTWPNQTVNSSGSGGTFTNFSVVTANGVSATVSNPTTTPSATFTLGAITPTSVNGVTLSGSSTPTLSVSGTSSITGTNTGDQNLSGLLPTTLAAATTITGSSTNTLKFSFPSLGTTLTNGAGLHLQNPTAALTGAQQISPIITSEGNSFVSTVTKKMAFQQYVKPIQSSNSLPYGDYWFDAQLDGGTPTHTFGIKNTNVLSLPGTNAYASASGIEIFKNSTPSGNSATVFIGAQGNTEINLSYNMDYHNIAVNEHHYYDATKDAVWYYQSPSAGGIGVQATKAGYTNTAGNDVWLQGGSAIPIKIDFIKNGAGDYVTGGNKYTGQRIELIDDNYSSPNLAITQNGTITNFTGTNSVAMPRLNIGTGTMVAGTLATYKATGATTYLEIANSDNNTNFNKIRSLKNKAGSYDLGTGTRILEFDYNGGVGYSGTRATSTVLSGFSNLEYYWQTTKSTGGASADRMILGEDGKLSVNGSIVSPKQYIGSLLRTPTASLHLHPGSALAGTAPIKLSYVKLNILTCTGSGTSVSITFADQSSAPFDVGQTITVSGETPSGYNGNYVVVTCTTSSLSYASATTGAQTVMGIVSSGRLSTPEDGVIDRDDVNLFFTNATGVEHTIAKILSGSAALDFPSTSAQTSSDLTITVTGAVDGDEVTLGVPNAAVNSNSSYTAWVSASNTVTVRLNNYSSAAVDPSSATFKVSVIKR